ncbi:MAG TPA: hypothetical protein VNT32_02265 [Thermoleophilaceae bacterium]|nr:hypothetical protein [Thermoleophilaceae bacterium]
MLPDLIGHGLVQRADLPIPEWLFGWAAAVVLVVSFVALAVLWPQPRLEGARWRGLPGGGAAGSRVAVGLGGAIGVGLLGVTVLSGLAGEQIDTANFTPTFVYVIFWVGLVPASVLFGDVFRALNPWRALGRLLRLRARRPYPGRLGHWPAAAGIFAFTWMELALEEAMPRSLAIAALVYTALTLAAMARYGADEWSERGEAFGVYFNLFSRISPFEVRHGVLGVRPPLAGLAAFRPQAGTVGLLAVMIGTVTFDGFSAGSLWADLEPGAADETARVAVRTLGMLAAVGAVAGFYALGVAGARTAGGRLDAEGLRRAFAHSLVPIAVAYVMAHYLTLLVFQGQAMGYLVSDPLGRGSDLFGTADSAIDFSLLSQNATWYLQVGFVVAGHVAALALAHDRALVAYRKAKQAVRSQYWMLAVMVGFTTLALWLLASANS